jgi:2-polyprenyl-6-hydroxyphenyl methylase/3-demethylubiquinone-9 3-methyltransferase
MAGYYAERLSAQRLQKCYEIAPARVRQYLDAEIAHLRGKLRAGDAVLELGCGYGRVLGPLAAVARMVVGIDTSRSSVQLARRRLAGVSNCHVLQMDAGRLGFRAGVFDVVACIQNGISAFGIDQRKLIAESLRVTRTGGQVVFSSYSARFWRQRLAWFELQAAHGLLGEIDQEATGDGVIVCKDGFRATTVSPDDFALLTSAFDVDRRIEEVDESSVFCELVIR